MNLNEIIEHNNPFKHWEILNCLNNECLNEISFSQIPNGNRAYDGTRAADYTGEGLDGKLRLFITKQNSIHFPNLTSIINKLQSKDIVYKISNILKKDFG